MQQVASCSKFQGGRAMHCLARARRRCRVLRRSPCPPHPAGERRGRLSSLPTANCLLYFCFWALPAPRRPRGPRPGAPASGRGPSRSPWSSGQPAGRRCHSGAGRLSVNQRSVLEAVFGPCRHQPPVDRGRGRGPGRRHIRAWPRPGPLATAERPSAGGSPQLPSYWKGGRVLAGAAAGVVSCAARQRVRPSERGRTDANPGGPALRCWCATIGPPAICAPQAREREAGRRRRGEQGPREGEGGLLAAPRMLPRAAKTEPPCRGSREDERRLDNSLCSF